MKLVHTELKYVCMYVCGFLAFREVPRMEATCKYYPQFIPDVLFVDGNGRLHPERLGHASHLGVLLDMPTWDC